MSKTATILTWGCTHNQKDSQLLEQVLLDEGYILEKCADNAEILILNTCTVKTPTEDKIIHVLEKYKDTDKLVVVAGCLSQADPKLIEKKFPNSIVLGVNAINYLIPALNNRLNGIILPMINIEPKFPQNKSEVDKDWIEKPLLNSTQWNKFLNIVQINEGCLNSCTFCATKFARGKLKSFKKNSILHAVRKYNTPEVWLTSQDTSCWGFDINDNIANLLNDLSYIERKFVIRIGMGNPNNLIKIVDEVIEAYQSDKIFKFLHLPLQAGNNIVLKNMKRGYKVEEYELIVTKFRNKIPNITISTDIICGYPTETEDQFLDTLKAIENTRPSICNISRYWERKGTKAASLTQIPHHERKRRSKLLTNLMKDIKYNDNKKWIGWKGEVLVNELGSKGGFQSRNIYYKPIIIHDENLKLGTWIDVEITEFTDTHFIGKII